MKKNITVLLLLVSSIFYCQNTSVLGKWKTIDDKTGKPISVVEIYEKSGKIYGKVSEIFDATYRNNLCKACTGEDADKPILGMVVIKGLSKEGSEYGSGKILDPKNGKLYQCYITLVNADKLKVRGYIGISLLGRTQYWYRIKK